MDGQTSANSGQRSWRGVDKTGSTNQAQPQAQGNQAQVKRNNDLRRDLNTESFQVT